MIKFEKLTEEHVDRVLEIYNYYVENSTATFHLEPINRQQMKQLLFFDDDMYGSYTIFNNNEIIGYCILSPFNVRQAYRQTLSVAIYLQKDYTSKGYGVNALRFLEEIAIKKNARSLIGLICAENTKSIRLFEKNGYKKAGYIEKAGIKFNRELDVVYYQKLL